MKISYNWLKKYFDTDVSPIEISEILTDIGLEVEGLHKIEAVKGGLKGAFVGEILTTEQHPNADRLKITNVSVGDETLQIVCGASNAIVGMKVIVATVGSILWPNPNENFKIKKSKIRGIESLGMICAEDELGLGKGHDGILELDSSALVGTPASTYFSLENDYEIEIGLTPNRSDAMGHIGVARDLVAYLNVHKKLDLSLKIPSVESFKVDNNDLKITISVEDSDACPRYMGVTISGVSVTPSPSWLQNSLRSIGVNPINNIVDVTNYVMHELGTPLHAFDAKKIKGKIVVKTAKKGKVFKTLDEIDRKLNSSNLMITNGTENLCIAGILGGLDSGINNNTREIFLESAYFNPISIRKTAKMFSLNTDASFRFERGVDPNLTDYALKRAVILIQELAGGQVSMDIVDINNRLIKNKIISFDYERCNKLIGANLTIEMVNNILKNLDIKIISKKGTEVKLEIPAYRVDVTREADVIEEVLRIYGFNNVPLPDKLNYSIISSAKIDVEKYQSVISEMLLGMGFSETLSNSLTKSSYSMNLGGEAVSVDRNVELLNPLSQDLDVMRQTLLFNMMEVVAHNQNRQSADLKLYEYGKIYHKSGDNYSENKRLIILLTGLKQEENWNSTKEQNTYYTIKGVAKSIFKRLGIDGILKEKSTKKSLLDEALSLYILKNKVGEIGCVSTKMKQYFGIKNDVFIADLDWDIIIDSLKYSKIKFRELPKSFAVRRDFSLLIDSTVNFSEIEEIAKDCDRKILQEVRLFDVYEGENIAHGKKSYAISFKFQDHQKTLKDEQIDFIMDKIRSQLEAKLKAQLR